MRITIIQPTTNDHKYRCISKQFTRYICSRELDKATFANILNMFKFSRNQSQTICLCMFLTDQLSWTERTKMSIRNHAFNFSLCFFNQRVLTQSCQELI